MKRKRRKLNGLLKKTNPLHSPSQKKQPRARAAASNVEARQGVRGEGILSVHLYY
jgi:hypothetical protein